MHKQQINIVWFKRDLRFTDHEPLYTAQQQALPILMLYFFEPSVMANYDSDIRHWRFIYESLQEMQVKGKEKNAQLYIFHNEVEVVLTALQKYYEIMTIFSHMEVGNRITYDRDIAIQKFCGFNTILWKEFQLNGVIRKLKSRNNWQQRWQQKMLEPPKLVGETKWNILQLDDTLYSILKGKAISEEITTHNKNFQQGGEYWAWRYLDSFIKDRCINYSRHISKPLLSRKGCSRLSPYLAYGNISMRMVYRYCDQHYQKSQHKKAIANFISRLHWHCHFIQKFEDECSMEFENINSAYNKLIKPKNEAFIKAWQTGKTGVPLVDACMRCVASTGYIQTLYA